MYLVINKWVTAVKVSNFSGHYLRNRSTLDIGVLGYIGIVWPKEHSPEVSHIPPVTLCIYIWSNQRKETAQLSRHMQTSIRALYNSVTEKYEARASEWRFTTFDLRLSPFRVDLDGPLYTLVPPSYRPNETYWKRSRLAHIRWTLFTCQEFRSYKTGQRASWFCNFPSSVFNAQDVVSWLSFNVAYEEILCSWNGTMHTEKWWKNLWQFIK